MKIPVEVTVADKHEVDVLSGYGYYQTETGLIRCRVKGYDHVLRIDPESYNAANPRRMMYQDAEGTMRWSPFYLRSMVVWGKRWLKENPPVKKSR